MLKTLTIDQFVIIEQMNTEFKDRLTIFTGQTGAGKSIILGALDIILGAPSKVKSIRAGHPKSEFSATFNPELDHPVWDYMIEKGIVTKPEEQFVVTRVVNKDGPEIVKINDKDVSLETLKDVGTFLVEIHGQDANHTLLGSENQLRLLDLSGNFDQEFFDNVKNALDDVNRLTQELEDETRFLAKHKGLEAKKIQSLVRRFEELGMKEGFIEETQAEYDVLRRAKDTSDAFQNMLGRLIASDGAVLALAGAHKTLNNQETLNKEQMVDLDNFLQESLKNARSAVDEMMRIIPEYEIDTGPLHELKKILDGLHKISEETKVPFEKLAEYYDEIATKLRRIKNGREKLAELKDDLIQAKNRYTKHAHILSEKRVIAAQELSQAITTEMAPLKLNKAEFVVEVEEKPDMEWTEKGFDEITFTARMNPGTPFSPIAKTASGGEMARMILALKVVLQEVQNTPTLIFDEVDTGIGGSAAAAVGERISILSDNTQVIVITHSPQVASRGNQHWFISKRNEGDTTISSVRELSMDDRIAELSRMLAGDKPTDESDANARSLIAEAEAAAKERKAKAA